MAGPAREGVLASYTTPDETRQGHGAAGAVGLNWVVGVPHHDPLVFVRWEPLTLAIETDSETQCQSPHRLPAVLSEEGVFIVADIVGEVLTRHAEALRVAHQHVGINVIA